MVRTALVLAVLVALTTSTMRADPKVASGTSPAPSGPAAAVSVETSPVHGSMTVRNVKYRLNHIVAFETNRHGMGNERICIVVSNLPIPAANIASKRKDKDPRHLFQPHVVVWFTKDGHRVNYDSWAENHTCSGLDYEGELKIVDNRVVGCVKDQSRLREKFKSGFDFHFDAPLIRLDAPDTPPDPNTPELVLVDNADGEEIDSSPAPGNGLNFLQNLLGGQLKMCEGGNCAPMELSGACPPGTICGLESLRRFPDVGTFSVVDTSQGTIRIDTTTGKTCLLSLGADGKLPQWIEIQEPPLCSSPAVADQRSFGPSVAPDTIPTSAAAMIDREVSAVISSLTASVKEQTPVTALITKEDDKVVAFHILEALEDANLRGFLMEIQLSKGVATLHGVLSTPQMRDLAAEVAGKVPGVKSVVNELHVRWTSKQTNK